MKMKTVSPRHMTSNRGPMLPRTMTAKRVVTIAVGIALLLSLWASTIVLAKSPSPPQAPILKDGEMRTEPGINAGEFVGHLCTGDTVNFLGWSNHENSDVLWYYVELETTSCQENPSEPGSTGWIEGSLADLPPENVPFLGQPGDNGVAVTLPLESPSDTAATSEQPGQIQPEQKQSEQTEDVTDDAPDASDTPAAYEITAQDDEPGAESNEPQIEQEAEPEAEPEPEPEPEPTAIPIVDEPVAPASAILSPPRARPEQAVAYILNRGTTYSPRDVEVIVDYYWRIAPEVGIDPLIAISQNIIETNNLKSWWAQPPRHNPAGLLVTGERRASAPADAERHMWAWNESRGSWSKGLSFASWEESVQAHIALLLAYTLRDEDMNEPQRAFFNEVMQGRNPPYRGAAPTLQGLNGRWAVPGTTYANKISSCANAIRSK
jgi:hypothetical protein